MKIPGKILIGSIGAVVVIAGGAILFAGIGSSLFRQKQAHPPCDQLPTKQHVAHAIDSHFRLVRRLEKIGDEVTVDIGTPCVDQPGKAVVTVHYSTGTQKHAINKILGTSNGFGAPAILNHS